MEGGREGERETRGGTFSPFSLSLLSLSLKPLLVMILGQDLLGSRSSWVKIFLDQDLLGSRLKTWDFSTPVSQLRTGILFILPFSFFFSFCVVKRIARRTYSKLCLYLSLL